MENKEYISDYSDHISDLVDYTANHSERIKPVIESVIHDVMISIEDSFVMALKTNQTNFTMNLENVLKLIRNTKIKAHK